MTPQAALAVADLAWSCPADAFTEGVDIATGVHAPLGQERALDALTLAFALERPGYNVFAMGPEALGKRGVVLAELRSHARAARTR